MASVTSELATASSFKKLLHRFAGNFVDNFQNVAERLFRYMGGDFLQQLQSHLTELSQLSQEVERTDSSFGKRLWELKTDISLLRDYYHVLYTSIKGVVDYGTQIIPEIRKLIDVERNYNDASKIIGTFLSDLKERIEKVEKDIDKIKQHRCVNLDEIKEQIGIMINEYDTATNVLVEKINNEQKRRIELLKIGSTTFLCLAVAGVAGTMTVSYVPAVETDSELSTALATGLKHAAEMVGTEFFSIGAEHVREKLHYVISSDLQKKVELNASKIHSCFNSFFREIFYFQTKIHTITMEIGTLKDYNSQLQVKFESKPTDQKDIADWCNISIYLNQIYESLMYLKAQVIEEENDTD